MSPILAEQINDCEFSPTVPVSPTLFSRCNVCLFQMYSVQEQEFQLRFLVKNFPVGHKVLVDSADALDTGWGRIRVHRYVFLCVLPYKRVKCYRVIRVEIIVCRWNIRMFSQLLLPKCYDKKNLGFAKIVFIRRPLWTLSLECTWTTTNTPLQRCFGAFKPPSTLTPQCLLARMKISHKWIMQ